VADVLGKDQSVPAETDAVEDFLKGLFHLPNWVPGMPPINDALNDLRIKAQSIVDEIKGQASPGVKFCCGPHMEVAFEDASKVKGWKELTNGRVIDSNDDCKKLFGFQVPPQSQSFGEWFESVEGAGRDDGWVKELAEAVQAAGRGRAVPAILGYFVAADGKHIRPTICAVRRRKGEQKIKALDILFKEAELAHDTRLMNPNLAALAITLEFSVRFRYQVLERYTGRKLEGKDVLAFNRAMFLLQREAVLDPRFAKDPALIREQTLASFVGEDKDMVRRMYERADQMWRRDGEGEIDRAISTMDGEALAALIEDLRDMNQGFLTVTSKRFAELIAAG
jgi:hypothetical protein